MEECKVYGVFQAGILVTDIDKSLELFRDAFGMKVVFEARNQVQPAKGLSGVEGQIMNVVMLRGEDGVDLEIHQYVEPKAVPCPPMNHNNVGSTHFMLRIKGMEKIVEKIENLGYKMMTPIVESQRIEGFKYAYFRGPDDIMVELQEGSYMNSEAAVK